MIANGETQKPIWRFVSHSPARQTRHWALALDTHSRFGWWLDVTVPISFIALVVGTCAAIPWIGWSNRFSLRTLLIATTLVAVVLGAIVWLSR